MQVDVVAVDLVVAGVAQVPWCAVEVVGLVEWLVFAQLDSFDLDQRGHRDGFASVVGGEYRRAMTVIA